MGVRIISVYKSKDELEKIIAGIRRYSLDDFKKTAHFEFSIMEKATDYDFLKETFPRFDLIETIELRENDKGERHYGINYDLKDKSFVSIAIAFDKGRPLLINGFYRKTDYKKFEKSLRKYYGKKFS